MKMLTLVIIVAICVSTYLFFKINDKDNKARKDAIKISATVVKLKCKQRLKGDKSFILFKYQSKEYSVFTTESICNKYTLNQTTEVFYSKQFDKLFLTL